MVQVSFAMKAACRREQIADRIKKFGELGLEPLIELHLTGLDDISGNCRKTAELCKEHRCAYMAHFPINDPAKGYLFDMYNDEDDNFHKAVEFCSMIGSSVLIMHRCLGFGKALSKKTAEEIFYDKIGRWNDAAAACGITVLFENYGFVWLPKGFRDGFVTSPLDHFFPWDMAGFNAYKKRYGLNNTGILLDIAHATLSSNMFNMLKDDPAIGSDKRFANIYDTDMRKKERLLPQDFISDSIDYLHISDSFIWDNVTGTGTAGRPGRYLYTEGLPIGKGNIDFADILKKLSGNRKTMIMEIEPEGGDYNNNLSQKEAVEKIKTLLLKER